MILGVDAKHRIAQGFGIRTFHLDGTWFESMYQQLPPAIESVRRGAGPKFRRWANWPR